MQWVKKFGTSYTTDAWWYAASFPGGEAYAELVNGNWIWGVVIGGKRACGFTGSLEAAQAAVTARLQSLGVL